MDAGGSPVPRQSIFHRLLPCLDRREEITKMDHRGFQSDFPVLLLPPNDLRFPGTGQLISPDLRVFVIGFLQSGGPALHDPAIVFVSEFGVESHSCPSERQASFRAEDLEPSAFGPGLVVESAAEIDGK